jgi:nucleotide-binding universal stress UspA family protein
MKQQLEAALLKAAPSSHLTIRIVPDEDIARAIVRCAQSVDMVILRSVRRELRIGEFTLSNITTEVVSQLTCSVAIWSEPHWQNSGKLFPKQRNLVEQLTRTDLAEPNLL